jgi:hypothetical protein
MKKIMAVLFSLLLPASASAESFSTFLGTWNAPMLNIVSPSDGSVAFSGPISDGFTAYDTVTGEGTFDLTATLSLAGETYIHDTLLTTNADGSLHLEGLINFASTPSTDYNFIGDVMVEYNYDIGNDATVFTYSPIMLSTLNYPGLLMTSGPYTGLLLDFRVEAAFLAYVDNPYPVHSAVPLPSAAVLFITGLLTLGSIGRKRA